MRSWLKTVASFILGMLLVSSYASMVMDIIMILKARTYSSTYPPAVVALLVVSILEAVYVLLLVMFRGRSLARASVVEGTIAFFTCFVFGAVVATTVLRHHRQYCNTTIFDNVALCGAVRGTEALGWMLFIFNLFYLCTVPLLVSRGFRGTWSHTLKELPVEEVIEPEKETV